MLFLLHSMINGSSPFPHTLNFPGLRNDRNETKRMNKKNQKLFTPRKKVTKNFLLQNNDKRRKIIINFHWDLRRFCFDATNFKVLMIRIFNKKRFHFSFTIISCTFFTVRRGDFFPAGLQSSITIKMRGVREWKVRWVIE